MVAVVLIAALILTAGCTGDEPSPDATATSPSTEEIEKDVTALYKNYWSTLTKAEKDLNPDPKQFDDILAPDLAKTYSTFITNFKKNNLYRYGEPDIGEITVTVDGSSALAQTCVNNSAWLLLHSEGGQVQQMFPAGINPYVVEAKQQDNGRWLITKTPYENRDLSVQRATITCPAPKEAS